MQEGRKGILVQLISNSGDVDTEDQNKSLLEDLADSITELSCGKSILIPQKETKPSIECTMEICQDTSSSERMNDKRQVDGTRGKYA